MTRRRTDPATTLRAGRLALLTTSAVTLGFQSIVTSVVYPQLFDGTMNQGAVQRFTFEAEGLASGVYIYRATGDNFVASRQVLLLK